jgi:hypothetical protein
MFPTPSCRLVDDKEPPAPPPADADAGEDLGKRSRGAGPGSGRYVDAVSRRRRGAGHERDFASLCAHGLMGTAWIRA